MIQKPTWLGNFYGGNLGFQNYEIFTIQHFTRKELKDEAELMTVKWFDYRRLHPLQATYYFVHCYTEAYRDFYRKTINVDRAPYVRCFSDVDFLTARERATVFRLRQLVDRLGMRYDFFLNFAMNWHHKMSDAKGHIHAPRPGHLVSNEALIADAMIAWEEQCEVALQVARDSYFRVSNFNGRDSNQYEHEAFVIGQIDKRRHPRYALSAALYVHDVVRIGEAVRVLDVAALEAIKEFESALKT